MRFRHITIAVAGVALLAAACSDDSTADDTTFESSASPLSTPRGSAEPTSSVSDSNSSTSDSSDTESPATEPDLEGRVDGVGDALADGDFTTMLDLLELSGLADELDGREVTVLAPMEEAFRDLDVDEFGDLIADPSSAADRLRLHVIDGLFSYDELAELAEVTTISDEILTVTVTDGVVSIDGAAVSPPKEGALSGDEGQEIAVFGIDRLLSQT